MIKNEILTTKENKGRIYYDICRRVQKRYHR